MGEPTDGPPMTGPRDPIQLPHFDASFPGRILPIAGLAAVRAAFRPGAVPRPLIRELVGLHRLSRPRSGNCQPTHSTAGCEDARRGHRDRREFETPRRLRQNFPFRNYASLKLAGLKDGACV